jgi:hypothetical protein
MNKAKLLIVSKITAVAKSSDETEFNLAIKLQPIGSVV